jgi:Plant transposon protein
VNFGDAGSLNDLNVLDRSSIVGAMLSGDLSIRALQPYTINGNERDWMYYLVDGIYPGWSIFVNTSTSTEPRKKKFAKHQERVRKDIECAFGILVQRFHILQRPLRNWYLDELSTLVQCCIIIHNMVIEARAGVLSDDSVEEFIGLTPNGGFPLFGYRAVTQQEALADGCDLWAVRVSRFERMMESAYEHVKLKQDLINHINSLFP